MKKYRLPAVLIATLLLLTLLPFSPPVSPVLADITSVTITSPTTTSPAYAKTGGKVNVAFTVNCTDNGTADIEIEVLSDSTPVASLNVYNVSMTSGNNNLNYDVTLTGVAAGQYNVKVRARQPAGSGTWVSSTVQQNAVIVENTPPTVTLYQPTTGACLTGGGNFNIVWVATDTSGQKLNYKLEYFNGSTWSTIVDLSNQDQGQRNYIWTVPPSLNITNAQVKVTATDKAGNSATAASGAFIIDSTPPTVTQIMKPTTGEKLTAGSTYQLQWVASDTLPGNLTYKLEYRCSGDSDWTVIQSSLSGPQGTNTYNWTVPARHNNDCRVRITPKDCAGNEGGSQSTGSFAIEDKTTPTCKVNSPNGGEVWSAGTTRDIEWTCIDNTPGNVTIEMFYCHNYTSPDSCNIPVDSGSYSQGSGSYTWNVPTPPSGQTSDQCRVCIKCTDAAGNSSSDCSDNNFTIVKHNLPPTVQLLSPNGGETWQGGTCQVIRWTATDPADSHVPLDYKLEYHDGAWHDIVTLKGREQGENTFCWAVPDSAGVNYKVRVTATGPGGSASDESDSNFEVTAATAPAPETATINLKAGWNLISLQLMPTCCPSNNTACAACAYPIESILADCLDKIKSVWYWTGGPVDSGAWLNYAPGAPSSLTTMTDGKAYWIYATADCSFTYQGRKGPAGGGFPTTPYNYVPGWNMVGFKSTTNKQVQAYLGGTCGGTSPTYVTPVYCWDETTQSWCSAGCSDNMTPGRGYWVYFNTAHIVNAGAD